MAIPDVALTFRDGSLGLAPPASTNAVLHIGPSALGQTNTVYSFSDLATLAKTLGNAGPLSEAAALQLAYGGGPVYAMPVNPGGTPGAIGAITKTGVGADTLTAAAKNSIALVVKIVLGGASGTATFQVSFDGGVTYPYAAQTTVTAGGAVPVTGANNTVLAFTGVGAGAYVAGDTWSISAAGVAVLSGTGTGAVAVHANTSPVDAYTVQVSMTLAGALGVSQFTYSLDNNLTVSGNITTPSSGIYVIPDTGIVLTFVGTTAAGNLFNFTTTTQGYLTADITAAITAAVNSTQSFNELHVMGGASSVAAAASLFASVDVQLSNAAVNSYKFMHGLVDVPTDTDANIGAAFNASSSVRVDPCVSTYTSVSALKSYQLVRPSSWLVAARVGKVPPPNDLGRVLDGSLPGVIAITRDERITQALDAQRFTTLRTILGKQGFWITSGRLMAPTGSDFSFLQNRRVLDIAAAVVRNAMLNFLNDSVLVDPSSGNIVETSAQQIENYCLAALSAALTQPGWASSASVQVNRTNNIISTQQLQTTVRVVPLGYAKSISVDIGFTNPALQLKTF